MPVQLNSIKEIPKKKIYSAEERKKFPSSTKENKKEYMRRYFLKKPWMYYLELSRGRCKNHPYYNGEKKKVIHTLTKEEIERIWFRDKAWDLKRSSLNRIKTDGHYIFENCEFIELSENQSRDNKGKNQYTRKKNAIIAKESEILERSEE